jgi:DNA helicase-2/ATP-dependent DNA helicase PcrA
MSELLVGLNDRQHEAVVDDSTALMIVAGAGSGKTRVLTHKIAYIIEQHKAWPSQILAITFTNKAAGEMRERLSKMLNQNDASSLWASTFHSMCVRMLRKWHEKLGLHQSFTIYDTDDSKRLMKNILNDLPMWKEYENIQKKYPLKMIAGKISDLKNELTSPSKFEKQAADSGDYGDELISKVYRRYSTRMKQLNALDFDDLISSTIELLEKNKDVQDFYHQKFKYILVDEYQDTNHAQYKLIRLLSRGKNANGSLHKANLVVVGDSDQSIYAFRGATIRNINEFDKDYPEAKTILLEQNYRSTNNILQAANAVIDKNPDRKKKELWSDNGEGAKIQGYQARDGYDEADFIIKKIKEIYAETGRYDEIAIFFRTNTLSRGVEEKLMQSSIPYKLIGGLRFYERKEIKDVLAYLRAVVNHDDDISLRRILNVPKRGIGSTSEAYVAKFAWELGCSFGSALSIVDSIDELNSGAKGKLTQFWAMIQKISDWVDEYDPELPDIILRVLEDSGYLADLKLSQDPQEQVRVDNVEELVNAAAEFVPIVYADEEDVNVMNALLGPELLGPEPDLRSPQDDGEVHPVRGRVGLSQFLEQVALVADSDSIPVEAGVGAGDEFEEADLGGSGQIEDPGQVLMMTLHTAKGLEFDNVFFTGLEEGTLPHKRSLDSEFELTEERRLTYVGITRARKNLHLSWAGSRHMFGQWEDYIPSRFLGDIPDALIQWSSKWDSASSPNAWNDPFEGAGSDDSDGAFDPFAEEFGFGSSFSGGASGFEAATRQVKPRTKRAQDGTIIQAKKEPDDESGFNFLRNRRRGSS